MTKHIYEDTVQVSHHIKPVLMPLDELELDTRSRRVDDVDDPSAELPLSLRL